MEQAIRIAQENSYDALLAKYSYMASYWRFRSFKAQLLPSVNLSGGLANFDHSLVAVRNYEDGQVAYVNNNSMTNSMTLSLDQKIAATGGTVSLQSYLYRLDQFSYDETTYNSQPLRISYIQPLRAYNSLKWEKKTAPVEYQIAQKEYVAAMENVAIRVISLFFNVLSAQSNYKQSVATQKDREALYEMSKKRLDLGINQKSDVLQLELSLLNARVAVKKNKLELDDMMYNLFSYLKVTDYENAELLPPVTVPDMLLGVDDVLQKAILNSSHTLEQKKQMLDAEATLAQAKANRGLRMTLSAEMGFTQSASKFAEAYRNLRDNEIVGLTLSLPVFDWGVSRGRVKMAKAQLEVTRTQIEQSHQDYVQELRKKVMQFNMQPSQCKDAQRAQDIAEERYEITRRLFEKGSISVTELNTAQQEKESANAQYIGQLQTFWTDYYHLQKATLYDWVNKRDLEVDFDKIVK
ncbi:MAG: TolC family protein [Bacteroidaceae bacterium]|nr:TolC family protein [Bacteroidaceae bacterium]